MRRIEGTDIDVFELCLGGNVFGWTADRERSFAVLDAYARRGGNFLDTADTYMSSAPGNSGGESETIIGEWMESRGNRDRIVLATKVGLMPGREGLSAANVEAAAADSLRRLHTDRIDLYYVHKDDPEVPVEETLGALDALVRAGKVRHPAASNLSPARLEESLRAAEREGFARYVALQPPYNLVERGYERELAPIVAAEGLACFPYFGLARGFLTGKYRRNGAEIESPRAERARAHLERGGERVLAVLEEVAAAHAAPMAAVALAWLAARPTVTAPIASARSPEQLEELLAFRGLELSAGERAGLDAAGAT